MRRATAPAVRAKRGHRAHTIGIRTVNVRGGKKVTLSVKLNKLGRRLLAKRGALHVYLTVTLIFRGHRTVLETKKVTLR